ncbi:MAG: lipid A biosynthesis acyltransferase [Desulfuromonas sp.]|nr:MAG: lipid A biosynthesis acyltransferase [Desulfuromonas sp.]
MSRRSDHKSGWSSRSIGSNWQHQFFYLAIKIGGRRAAYFVLYFVVAYYALFSRLARERAGHYVSRRFPEARGLKRLWHGYRMILNFGMVLIDRAVVGILGPDSFEVSLAGREQLLKIRDENRGMILMTAHVGCWQVAMSVLEFLERPVYMLMRQEDGDIDRHYFEHAGIECPYRVIDPTGYLGGTLEMLGVLKQGQVVSVMGDRLLGSDKSSCPVDFLGATATVPFSAYKIASASGAPIVIFFTRKSGPNSYEVEIARVIRVPELPGRESSTFTPYAQEFAEALEEVSRKHPYQFYNFHDMWAVEPPSIKQEGQE